MRPKRTDNNQEELVKQLRQIPGVSVAHTHMIGSGFPDLVIGIRGKNFLIELKNPEKSASRKRLTPDEKDFHLKWNGQIAIAETVTDILKLINL